MLMSLRALPFLLTFASFYSCINPEKRKQERLVSPPTEEVFNGIQKNKNVTTHDLIQITQPLSGEIIDSPLNIEGVARGYWFFEANFSVELRDEHYRQITETYAIAKGQWMTEDWVRFSSRLIFSKPQSQYGYLIFHKANPSGLAEHKMSDTLKIRFQ